MMLPEDNTLVDRFVEKAGRLYTLPTVAVQVLELTNHPTVDVHKLKQCIENDPALTTKVLRVVNSSLFGLSHSVSDLNQALTLLGTKPLKLLVLGFSLPDGLFAGVAGDMLRRYWRRTLTKAVAAREISESLWNLPGDEAFLAGLLQDVGMLVLLQDLGEPYARFLDLAFAKAADVAALEEKSIGFDHALLSARLLGRWGLPESLVSVMAAGRPPEKLAELPMTVRTLPQILHLAELLAGLLTENRCDLLAELLAAGTQLHHVTALQLTALVNTLQTKVEQLADVLSLELPASGDYNEVLFEAHARLSEVAADAAGDLLNARPPLDSAAVSAALVAAVQNLAATVREMARPIGGGIATNVTAASGSSISSIPTIGQYSGSPTSAIPLLPTAGHLTATHSAAHAPDAPHSRSMQATTAGQTDPGLLGVLKTIVSSCRQSRCALSLLVVGIDRFDDVVLTRGPEGAQRMVGLIGTICRGIGLAEVICRQTHDDRFVVILPGQDRHAGVEMASQLLRELRRIGAPSPSEVKPTMTVSIGVAAVALPPKNFQPQDLLAGAERCLNAAQFSGGNALKSIEIY